jgi:nucleoside-diphosphate-sugar epimerase
LISGAAVDAITEGLKATNKRLIVTSGSLVSAADPNGEETNESSPYWENPINNRIKSEQYALAQSEKGIRVTAIRLAPYVYGRGGSGVKLFMGLAAKSGEVVYIGDGSTRITTVHVDDAARLYLLAAKAESGGIYNATYETGVTQLQLSEAMGKILHLPTKSKSFDEVAAKSMVFLARFLSTENRASNAKARRELGWNPVEIGILEEIEKGSYTHVAETLGAKAA